MLNQIPGLKKKSKTVYDRNSFFLPTNLKYSDINTLKD